MLAKRIIVATFAVVAVALMPMAFSGPSDLFVDHPVGLTELASN